MRSVRLSDVARRQADALNRIDTARFYEIAEMLSEFLAPIRQAGLVRRARLQGQDFLLYSDKQTPFLIYFDIVSDDETEAEQILIQADSPCASRIFVTGFTRGAAYDDHTGPPRPFP